MNRELTTKQTALWIIGCVLFTMFCAYVVYTSLTAETHEQCIAGSQTRDGQECSVYETRPGPDTQMAFFWGLMGIVSLAMAVKLIWKEMKTREAAIHHEIKTRQLRNMTPTPWWAFWRIVNLIWKARQRRNVTLKHWWAFWR